MNYNEVKNAFLELKDILIKKKEAIIKKNLEVLNSTDEMAMVILEKINKFDILNNNYDENQKQELKKIGEEIKDIQKNNEILINHSLNVINNILSGILNIAQNEKSSYDAKGKGYQSNESLDISSITEEA